MVFSKSGRRHILGSDRSDSIIIPSDSDPESDFDDEPLIITAPSSSESSGPALLPTSQKRTQASQSAPNARSKAASQKPLARDVRFWYPDGNVVIKVGDTYFKLFRSRLAQQCRYFKALFSPPVRSQPEPSTLTNASPTGARDDAPRKELDGCAVYEVSEIEPSDFTTFINFLEYPLEHSVSTASDDKLYALLRASDILGCDLVHGLAKQAVAKQWSSLQPPTNSNTEVLRTLSPRRAHDAVQAIVHARKYRILGVLKRAFYELLRNAAFWDAVRRTHTSPGPEPERADDRAMLAPLSRGDLVRLQQARWELREAWDALLHTPPGSDAGWKGTTCNRCPAAQTEGRLRSRKNGWAVELADAGSFVSFRDPITRTYCIEEWLDSLKRHSEGKWCEGCLDERKDMWREARTVWWQKLDGWLQMG